MNYGISLIHVTVTEKRYTVDKKNCGQLINKANFKDLVTFRINNFIQIFEINVH